MGGVHGAGAMIMTENVQCCFASTQSSSKSPWSQPWTVEACIPRAWETLEVLTATMCKRWLTWLMSFNRTGFDFAGWGLKRPTGNLVWPSLSAFHSRKSMLFKNLFVNVGIFAPASPRGMSQASSTWVQNPSCFATTEVKRIHVVVACANNISIHSFIDVRAQM